MFASCISFFFAEVELGVRFGTRRHEVAHRTGRTPAQQGFAQKNTPGSLFTGTPTSIDADTQLTRRSINCAIAQAVPFHPND